VLTKYAEGSCQFVLLGRCMYVHVLFVSAAG
jgi:hypothetical protein